MAYINDKEIYISSAAASPFSCAIPPNHAADDILLAIITQNGGGTAIAAAGWTEIGTQAQSQGQRTAAFWKLAASSSESDFSATGAAETWIVSIIVVRGADTTSPIDSNNRTNSADSTTAYLDSTALTTVANNCLVFYAWGFDGSGKLLPADPNDISYVTKDVNGTSICQIVGYLNQITAGNTPVVRAVNELATEGGTNLCIAIADAAPATPQRMPACEEAYTIFRRFGSFDAAAHDNITWGAMSDMTAATINGIAVGTTVPTTGTFSDGSPFPKYLTYLQVATNLAAAAFEGGSFSPSSAVDMSGKIFYLRFGMSYNSTGIFGSEGAIVVFEDSTGAWSAFQLSQYLRTSASPTYYNICIDLENETPYDSNGAIDWTDVTIVGFAYHRPPGSASTNAIQIKNAMLFERTSIIDGCLAKPASLAVAEDMIAGWGIDESAILQGSGQLLAKTNIRFGDGVRETYCKLTGQSLEMPQSYTASIKRRFWKVQPLTVDISILTTANCTMDFSAAILKTTTNQKFTVEATSSSSATYDFTGCSFIGWTITNNASGVDFNNATFDDCVFTLNGGGLDTCIIKNPKSTPVVTTDDPGNIANCTFTSGGSGHAIEISATGTFTFEGNTFSGYGADASDDASIYNNSGGAVVLVLPSGTTQPTYKNGAGASTTFDTPDVYQSVTLTNGTAGARVQIYDVTASSELYNDVPASWPHTWTDPVAYAADREIRLRYMFIDGSTDAELFIDQTIGTCTLTDLNVSYYINPETDDVYVANAIDGSAVTGVTIDDLNLLVEVDTGTITWADIYAYETYWLSTEVGIRDEGRIIVAADTANYAFYGFKLKNTTAPSVTLVITGGYGIDGDTGASVDMIDTNGGTVVLAPDHVVAYAVGSALTASQDTKLTTVHKYSKLIPGLYAD